MRNIVLFLLTCLSTVSAEDIIYLTWQNDPTTTMTIQWLSAPQAESDSIAIKKEGEEEWKTVSGAHKALPHSAPYILHTVEAVQLDSDARYSFRLPGDSKEHHFRTMPKDLSKPVRFITGGDAYHDDGDAFITTCKKAASLSPRFVLLGGDIAYAVHDKRQRHDKFDRWHAFLKAWSENMKAPDGCLIPILPVIGNHEVLGYYEQIPEQAKFFYALFPTPGQDGCKQMLFGKYLSICILDSGHTHPIGGTQTAWLQDALRKGFSYTHRFAVYHVPAYPSVRYFRMKESCAIRRHWVPLFERYKVNAVFENHEHAYKRTFPLIDGSEHPEGVVYIGDGSWGVKPRIPKRAGRTTYLAKSLGVRQFVVVDLTKESRTYSATTPDGTIVDTYSEKVQNGAA